MNTQTDTIDPQSAKNIAGIFLKKGFEEAGLPDDAVQQVMEKSRSFLFDDFEDAIRKKQEEDPTVYIETYGQGLPPLTQQKNPESNAQKPGDSTKQTPVNGDQTPTNENEDGAEAEPNNAEKTPADTADGQPENPQEPTPEEDGNQTPGGEEENPDDQSNEKNDDENDGDEKGDNENPEEQPETPDGQSPGDENQQTDKKTSEQQENPDGTPANDGQNPAVQPNGQSPNTKTNKPPSDKKTATDLADEKQKDKNKDKDDKDKDKKKKDEKEPKGVGELDGVISYAAFFLMRDIMFWIMMIFLGWTTIAPIVFFVPPLLAWYMFFKRQDSKIGFTAFLVIELGESWEIWGTLFIISWSATLIGLADKYKMFKFTGEGKTVEKVQKAVNTAKKVKGAIS